MTELGFGRHIRTDRVKNFTRDVALLEMGELGSAHRLTGVEIVAAIKVVAAVVGAISSLAGVFTQKKALNKIADALREIAKELGTIRIILNSIKEQLDAIEQKIDDQQTLNAYVRVKALQDVIVENYPSWILDDSAAILNDAHAIRLELQESNRILMRTGGYSYAFDLAVSFTYELNLGLLLSISDDSLQLTANSMTAFLKESIDEDVPGSIANRYRVSKTAIESLLQWEAALVRDEFKYTSFFNNDENQWGLERCQGDFYNVITGNLASGFKVGSEVRNVAHCFWTQWQGPWRNTKNETEKVHELRGLLAQAELDQKSALYRAHLPVVQFSEAAIPEIESIIAQIDSRVAEQAAITEA